MTIQFNHKRKFHTVDNFPDIGGMEYHVVNPRGGTTIALEVIEPWFFDSLAVNDFFDKKVGSARCSKDDNYCKKVGRQLSTQRMKTTRLVVQSLVSNETEKIIILVDSNNNLYILKKINGHKVHFVGYNE